MGRIQFYAHVVSCKVFGDLGGGFASEKWIEHDTARR
jgi:hypothetical protein